MDNIFIPKDHQVYNDLKESDYLQIFNVDESNLKSILRGGALTDIQLYKKIILIYSEGVNYLAPVFGQF